MTDAEQGYDKETSLSQKTDASPHCRLDLVYFGLFDNCNARCIMCNCWRVPRSRLGLAHYQQVLRAVLSLQPAALRFTGGEPLLFPHMAELVRETADAGVRVSLISNGLLLARKVAGLATAGCAEIVLSLDAFGEHHNSIRQTPGLFAHCLAGLTATSEAGLSYGINTVCQARSIDDLPALADLLLTLSKRPAWWHLIPIRDQQALTPAHAQISQLRRMLPALRQRLSEGGISLIADQEMFSENTTCPCHVPAFTAYVRADTGQVYGCNMLSYAGEPIGNLLAIPAHTLWRGQAARELRLRCAQGQNSACARCDPSSRAMNYHWQQLARDVAHHRPISSGPVLEGG